MLGTRSTGFTIYAEKMYSKNFTAGNKNFCISLHYNGDNSYLFVNGKEIINFKAKDSKIVPYPLCLGNSSKDFSPSNAAKVGLSGYIYDFSVDYWAIARHSQNTRHSQIFNEKEQYSISVWVY